jgi:twinkle protein
MEAQFNMNIIHDIDLRRFMARQQSQSIRPVTDFFDGAMERLAQGSAVFGDQMPWSKTADKFRFRPKEMTIWAGENGGGKSLVQGQTALWLAAAGKKVLIASMEMPGEATVARMLRQGCGSPLPPRDLATGLMNYTKDKIWIYDQIGSVKPEDIIAMIHWAAEELGIDHIMIDSLVKCGVKMENENQRDFVDALAWAAKEHKIHIHLVHHIRKAADEKALPDKYSVKGAGEIVDLTDNLLIIMRNKAKEAKIRMMQEYDHSEPDGYIRVAKQRHGEFEGLFAFWFDARSQQWIPEHGMPHMPFPPPDENGKFPSLYAEVEV